MQDFIRPCPHKFLLKVQNRFFDIFNEFRKWHAYLFEFQQITCIWFLRGRFNQLSPSIHHFLNNIAILHYTQGDYEKALEYNNKALPIRQSVLGENHPDVASSYNNLGLIYFKQENYKKALEYFQKALNIRQQVFGADHPSTQKVQAKIEEVQSKM